jgi:hypothetical protein
MEVVLEEREKVPVQVEAQGFYEIRVMVPLSFRLEDGFNEPYADNELDVKEETIRQALEKALKETIGSELTGKVSVVSYGLKVRKWDPKREGTK